MASLDEDTNSKAEPKLKFKRRSLAGRKKLCPQCLSELAIATSVSGWLVPNYYFCSQCGYSGYVALENAPKEDC